jgi:hypothetical protein
MTSLAPRPPDGCGRTWVGLDRQAFAIIDERDRPPAPPLDDNLSIEQLRAEIIDGMMELGMLPAAARNTDCGSGGKDGSTAVGTGGRGSIITARCRLGSIVAMTSPKRLR